MHARIFCFPWSIAGSGRPETASHNIPLTTWIWASACCSRLKISLKHRNSVLMRRRLRTLGLVLVAALLVPAATCGQSVLVTGHVELVNRADPEKPGESTDAVVWLSPNSASDSN